MLAFVNHSTGKLIYTEKREKIPHIGLATTGWEQISQEEYRRMIDSTYNPPSWDYPAIKLYKKVRSNPDNKSLITKRSIT